MGELSRQSHPGMPGGGPLAGRRLPDVRWGEPGGGWTSWGDAQPGDYMKILDPPAGLRRADGVAWYIRDPAGRVGRLSTHTVTEHDDGTISVAPSILDDRPEPASEQMGGEVGAIVPPRGEEGWHGFLERGIWRSV